MMTKQEAIELLRQYLPPDRLREFLSAWWQWQQEDEALAHDLQPQEQVAHGETRSASEPWLEDCPHCGGAHLAGTIPLCPLNHKPIGDVVAAYRAMEAALQLLTGNILNLRTELLVMKALVAKEEATE